MKYKKNVISIFFYFTALTASSSITFYVYYFMYATKHKQVKRSRIFIIYNPGKRSRIFIIQENDHEILTLQGELKKDK